MIAQIIINSNVKSLNRIFDYKIPLNLEYKINVGDRVFIPFGNKKKLEEGFIVGISEYSKYEQKLKEIVSVESNGLNSEKIELAKWMANRYFCNISDCIKLMLPPGTTTKIFENRVNDKLRKFVYLGKSVEDVEYDIKIKKIKSEKQIKVLKYLIENENSMILSSELQIILNISLSILKTLEKNGYIEIVEKIVERNPFIHKIVNKSKDLEMNDSQKEIFEKINASLQLKNYDEFLLFGITGSGKTEIYIRLIKESLKLGKTSIMLVPEISLTPQTVDRFLSRFGEDNIAVLHSKLSLGERYDQWKKIEKGEAKIVIGARSAIFAPVKNLGIIIIDEEHDDSYKSETTPRYATKEIASYIAKKNNIPIILGSATPDMKSYYNAVNEKIQLLKLNKRANNSKLPEVELVDLREELARGNKSMISNRLKEEIEKNIKDKKQTILFLNRRGFSTFIMCRECGYVVKCKNCNIPLTYHIKENKLKCHYCGYEVKPIIICPKCKSKNIRHFGSGTQKLEEQVNKLFPQAKIIRMDIDTVTKKNSHEEILNRFKNDGLDILIGTQMVVKGHDFPNVTLVGVIAADSSLNIDDYRANERTFQTITQVAGRAGRGKDKGRVIIQTYNPDSFVINFAKKQDYELFYNTEIDIRKQLRYPPFCDIMLIGLSSENNLEIGKLANNIYIRIKEKIEKDNMKIMLYKPLPAPIDRIKNRYRWRIIIKCIFNQDIIDMMHVIMQEINIKIKKSNYNNTRIIVDINPTNMM